jgi:hypothetical protein
MAARSRSAFPGMDPWLEHPARWPNVHQSVITYSRDALQRQIGDRYFASIGKRVYVEAPEQSYYADVWIVEQRRASGTALEVDADRPVVVILEAVEHREVFLELLDAMSDERVVTVIEVLSPSNQRPGQGRDLHRRKQGEVLAHRLVVTGVCHRRLVHVLHHHLHRVRGARRLPVIHPQLKRQDRSAHGHRRGQECRVHRAGEVEDHSGPSDLRPRVAQRLRAWTLAARVVQSHQRLFIDRLVGAFAISVLAKRYYCLVIQAG